MKYFGSKSDYSHQRTRELLRTYFRYIKSCNHIRMPEVFDRIVDMPASRFWVSPARASIVLANIMRGDDLAYMRPSKREMFFEIYHRVLALQKKHPDLIFPRLVEMAVAQPAPKFYLSPGSARVYILKARKKWFADKKKKH